MSKIFASRLALVAAVSAYVGAALSQTPAAPPAASSSVLATPDRTTASFGDWTMRCERLSQIANAPRVCEIAQSIIPQGQQQPIAQIAIGRVQRTDPLRFTIVLPTNVTLTSTPKFAPEETGGVAGDTIWQRCIPGGCIADAVIRDDMMKRMRARAEPGRIEFRDAAGRDLKVAFSLRGLAQALDALAKE